MRSLLTKHGLLFLPFVTGLVYSGCSYAGGNLLQLNNAGGHYDVLWQGMQLPITWKMSSDGLPGSGISNTDLQLTLQNAYNSWENTTSNVLDFSYGGEVSERFSGIDGINLISFTDSDIVFSDGVLALAINYSFTQDTIIDSTNNDFNKDGIADIAIGFYPAGTIYEADIVFNASNVLSNTGVSGTNDIEAVALHEIGHTIGLSHSIVAGAVMQPFLSQDITSARTIKTDDAAYAAHLYPSPLYTSNNPAFGSISGVITNGFGGQPILGAHVFAVDPLTGNKIVGAYSLEQGDYLIPGLPTGNYYVGIEPLDGDPVEADPARINQVIKDTFDTNFVTEFFDSNESNIEVDPNNAELLSTISASVHTILENINLVTNTVDIPGVGITLQPGLNIFSYPVETPQIGFTAFSLLQHIGNSAEINSIDRYNYELGRYERAYWSNGVVDGFDFDIQRGEGYLIHMNVQKVITFEGQQNCPLINTEKGFNLIGVPCPPAGYSAFDLLISIGGGVVNVQRYNTDTNVFEIASLGADGNPVGNDFVIANGVGYVVVTNADKTGVSLPGLQQIFPPFITGMSPGRGVIGTQVMITGQGFSDDPVKNDVLFNGVRAAVNYASASQLVVTVPGRASTGSVSVAVAGKVSNNLNFIVESLLVTEAELQGKDMIDGQTVQGNLDTNEEQDRYTFIASKGASITATAKSVVAGVPDLLLFLEGPSGEVLTYDDNSAGGTDAKINRYEAARTGRYTLVVAAKPETGSGAYMLDLDIEHTPPIQDITILDGDYQTGLMGTQLTAPLEILVTGPNGLPMVGAAVSVISNDADNIAVSSGFTAATYQVLTNSSGIVKVKMDLPATPGTFDIVIEIPGYSPKTIKAASVSSMPVKVLVGGNGQNCGGSGCPVNMDLPHAYTLQYLDYNDLPVEGVITRFSVVSGGGSLQPGGYNELSRTSSAQGWISVTHRLGERVYDIRGKRIPQIVAVTGTNPGSELLLFDAVAKAGAATKLESYTSGTLQVTMGTAVLDAIRLKVTDAFGNAVEDEELIATDVSGSGLAIGSFINGALNTTLITDARGEFSGVLVADYQDVGVDTYQIDTKAGSLVKILTSERFGMTGVAPTIDEFGQKIPNTEYYKISIGFAVGDKKLFYVNVDMGPRLIAVDEGIGLQVGSKHWIGKQAVKPVLMRLFGYKRIDQCDDVPGGATLNDKDLDGGEWRDDNFEFKRFHFWYVDGVFTDYTASRIDGITGDDPALTNSVVAMDALTGLSEPSFVTMPNARGAIKITANTRPTMAMVKRDRLCRVGITADGDVFQTNLEDYIGDYLADWPIPGIKNVLQVEAVSPEIAVTINDKQITEPYPDPLPLIRSASGVDTAELNVALIDIQLNENTILSSSISTLELNKYPNFIQAFSDGVRLDALDSQVLQSISPGEFKFVYYPTATEIDVNGVNKVGVTGVKDSVGNTGIDVTHEFTLP